MVQRAVNTAFLDGFHLGSWVSAGITLVGAAMALRWLPSRAADAAATEQSPVDESSDSLAREVAPVA